MSGQIALPIAPDHPAFAGHFPGMPVLPGVVLLDEALFALGRELGRDLSACIVGSLKFVSPIAPGEIVHLQYELQASGTIRFNIVSGARRVATGSVQAAGQDEA